MTNNCLAPSLFGGGLGWGLMQKQCWHRACLHSNLPPEGVGAREAKYSS